MIVNDYISQKFQTFGINLSEADLIDMLNGTDFEYNDDAIGYAVNVANIAMTEYIPSLLLRATSINENGFSMSWNIDGIKDYYSIMCTL